MTHPVFYKRLGSFILFEICSKSVRKYIKMAGAEKIRIFNFGASVLVLKCRKPSKNCTNACKNFKENVLYYN